MDAELTNGADITVTGSTSNPSGQLAGQLASIDGVGAVVPMQHRLAYVGADLQDLYGIDPAAIANATTMSNAYFGSGDASATLAALRSTPDGVLLSEETVADFQLQPNDMINLRLQSVSDHQYHAVPFRFIGVVREFPTAPSDSFIVANADYVAKWTGSAAAEVVLIRTTEDPAKVLPRLAAALYVAAVARLGEDAAESPNLTTLRPYLTADFDGSFVGGFRAVARISWFLSYQVELWHNAAEAMPRGKDGRHPHREGGTGSAKRDSGARSLNGSSFVQESPRPA
ncbi:MAG: hypothetical protein J0H94_19875 [Rhizobiales bacterium]|nr:hypothetical protein [Hyphomicrobiales bacterium]